MPEKEWPDNRPPRRKHPDTEPHLSLLLGGAGFLWLAALDDLVLMAAAVFVLSLVHEAFRPAAMSAIAE